jgi:hypothetical protein
MMIPVINQSSSSARGQRSTIVYGIIMAGPAKVSKTTIAITRRSEKIRTFSSYNEFVPDVRTHNLVGAELRNSTKVHRT